jgi:uncharacterized protein (TIGR02217 family)
MPNMFHDVRLPEDIEAGAVGGPTFYTNVTSISSGAEQRTIGWDRQRHVWQLGYGIQSKEDYETILAFFYARQGKAYGFRFRDFSDYQAVDAEFGVGNSTNRVFRLVKPYESGDTSFDRVITHPVAATVTLKANGTLIDASTYDVEDFGIIRFHPGQAPANGIVLTWSGEFDVPVRFDIDQFNLTLGALAAGEVLNNALPIVELREQINNPPTDIVITSTLHASLDETQDTSARIALATFDIVDDDLGVNAIGLAGTNPLYFEAELATDTRSGTLYLKAGVLLNYEVLTSLSVTLETWDTIVGTRPSATRTFTLAINNIPESPVVTLSNETHALLAGTSTASRVHLADIAYTVDSGQSVAFTLSGADAAHFEYFGGNVLYLKAGEDTASIHHYTVNIVATPTTAAATVVPFVLTIGIVPGETIYDTPGTYSYTVTEYGTLEIDVWAAGCATWGYTPGTPTAPTAPGRTYVQNDQTVTLEHRWRVEPFRMTDNPDAWTPGYKIATATMDSLGIGAALTDSNPGNVGGTGITPTTKATDFDAPSGAGGYQVNLDASVVLGGALVRAAEPGDGLVTTADGLPGGPPGTGASGGVYKKNTVTPGSVTLGTTPPNSLTFTSMAGAGSGHFALYAWTYGTAQVGTGAGYTAPAPAVGDILTIVIGNGGVKGSGTVNGANGGHGRVRIAVS